MIDLSRNIRYAAIFVEITNLSFLLNSDSKFNKRLD